MRDSALNKRATFHFPCLIGKLCHQTEIPPNCMVDRLREASRIIQVSKIKDLENHLFGVKSTAIGGLDVVL